MRLFLMALALGALVGVIALGPGRGGAEGANGEPAASPAGGFARARPWVRGGLVVLAVALLGLVGCAAQRSMIYHPTADGDFEPARSGPARIESVELRAADGVRLHAWYLPPPGDADPRTRPAVLYLHGNAGNLTHRRDLVEDVALGARAHVLIVDYRGFGRSEGSPDEDGLYEDAVAGFDWLAAREDVDPARIVVFGRSLGGGVAAETAVRRAPAGLVLESTFTSMSDMARVVTGLPVGWLVVDRFASIDKVGGLGCPLLVIHGEADELIPVSHGKALHAAAPEPKQLLLIPGGRHNDTPLVGRESYRETLFGFIERCGAGAAEAPATGR